MSAILPDEILKRDALGRVASWVQERRRVRGGHPSAAKEAAGPVRLSEAMVEGNPCGSRAAVVVEGLVIELPGGSRMRIESPMQLQMAAELVALIAQRACARC